MTPDDIIFPQYQGHCSKVSIINGARSHFPAANFVIPARDDHKYLDMACYSFLIESEHKHQKVMFDLSFMKDIDARMPPALKAMFAGGEDDGGAVDEVHDVPDTLQHHGTPLSDINAIIWSHSHIDHVGDPSVFPPSTELIVGPGFKAAQMPGYPTNPGSFVLQSAFDGRNAREVDFTSSTVSIGGFRAVDLFEDASLFLLETPGHTPHHLSALCRTTEDSWVLLGGDACHSVAQLRPSQYRPLPSDIEGDAATNTARSQSCSCTTSAIHSQGTGMSSIYDLAPGMHELLDQAKSTVERLKAFDGRDDVLVVIAHDPTLLDVVDFYPSALNEWKGNDWAKVCRWRFMRDFGSAVAPLG